jgi:hypothetical protein
VAAVSILTILATRFAFAVAGSFNIRFGGIQRYDAVSPTGVRGKNPVISEMGVITPPVGVNVFVIKGIAPEVPLQKIYRGILPFLAAIIILTILLWIYRITVNTARDFHRRKRFFEPLAKVVKGVRFKDTVLQDEIRNRLTGALALLSFNERAVFIFKTLEEMETAEVAGILGCREVTVRSHLTAPEKNSRGISTIFVRFYGQIKAGIERD